MMRCVAALLALAVAGGARDDRRICVPAVHNAEFSSSPANFAHWLLAHAMLFTARLAAATGATPLADAWPSSTVVEFGIAHGGNTALLEWEARCALSLSRRARA